MDFFHPSRSKLSAMYCSVGVRWKWKKKHLKITFNLSVKDASLFWYFLIQRKLFPYISYYDFCDWSHLLLNHLFFLTLSITVLVACFLYKLFLFQYSVCFLVYTKSQCYLTPWGMGLCKHECLGFWTNVVAAIFYKPYLQLLTITKVSF